MENERLLYYSFWLKYEQQYFCSLHNNLVYSRPFSVSVNLKSTNRMVSYLVVLDTMKYLVNTKKSIANREVLYFSYLDFWSNIILLSSFYFYFLLAKLWILLSVIPLQFRALANGSPSNSHEFSIYFEILDSPLW